MKPKPHALACGWYHNTVFVSQEFYNINQKQVDWYISKGNQNLKIIDITTYNKISDLGNNKRLDLMELLRQQD